MTWYEDKSGQYNNYAVRGAVFGDHFRVMRRA